MYTKEETYDRTTIDEMIAGGGGTTDYNDLSNRPIVDDVVVSKTLKMESGSLLHLDGGASELCLGSRELPPSIPPTYVAVGGSMYATSRDGLTWNKDTSPMSARCIAFGNNTFVALGMHRVREQHLRRTGVGIVYDVTRWSYVDRTLDWLREHVVEDGVRRR